MATIPKEELDRIEAHVMTAVDDIWGVGNKYVPLHVTFCDRCSHENGFIRQRCVGNVLSGEHLCASCWAKKYKQELIDEWLQDHPPIKLDLKDFCRI